MKDKHAIVPLSSANFVRQRPTKPRNNLLLTLKKEGLELNLYSSLDSDVLKEILEKVL